MSFQHAGVFARTWEQECGSSSCDRGRKLPGRGSSAGGSARTEDACGGMWERVHLSRAFLVTFTRTKRAPPAETAAGPSGIASRNASE